MAAPREGTPATPSINLALKVFLAKLTTIDVPYPVTREMWRAAWGDMYEMPDYARIEELKIAERAHIIHKAMVRHLNFWIDYPTEIAPPTTILALFAAYKLLRPHFQLEIESILELTLAKTAHPLKEPKVLSMLSVLQNSDLSGPAFYILECSWEEIKEFEKAQSVRKQEQIVALKASSFTAQLFQGGDNELIQNLFSFNYSLTPSIRDVKEGTMESQHVEVKWDYKKDRIDMHGTGSILTVRNVAESTVFAFLDSLLDTAENIEERITIIFAAYNALMGANAKYIMVMKPKYSIDNLPKEGINSDLENRVGLFYVNLKNLTWDCRYMDLRLEEVKLDNPALCREVSTFQLENLIPFRKLDELKVDDKVKSRYNFVPFCQRIAKGVFVFAYKDYFQGSGLKQGIVATITLNLHRNDGVTTPSDHRVGYVSDLFFHKDWDSNSCLLADRFMHAFYEAVKKTFPEVEFLWGMAATNDLTIPIASCFNGFKQSGLVFPLTEKVQKEFGVCVRLKSDAPKSKHDGKKVSTVRQSLFNAAIVTHTSPTNVPVLRTDERRMTPSV